MKTEHSHIISEHEAKIKIGTNIRANAQNFHCPKEEATLSGGEKQQKLIKFRLKLSCLII